jgi:hypothetical protein
MRIMVIAAAMALSGCATAVYDSLERRGIDASAVLVERLDKTRADMLVASESFAASSVALVAVDQLDGAALAQQSNAVKAAGQDAALAAQDLRLSLDSAKTAAARYFREREDESALMESNGGNRDAAGSQLAATNAAWRAFETASDASALRLSPALSLYDAEASALRRNPTSGLAAASRAKSRAGAIAAIDDVRASLDIAVKAGDDLRSALN